MGIVSVVRSPGGKGRTAPREAPAFYAAVRLVVRFWLWFFFKPVDVRHPERVPVIGPVLLCINHPNNLIDSLVVGAALPRKVHYLAAATLFRNRLIARFLRACGAIRVYGKKDDPNRMDPNGEAFAACFQALERGHLIAIYPEGTTHAEPHVQRLKSWAARIALGYETVRPDELSLIPVGLTFGRASPSWGECFLREPIRWRRTATYEDSCKASTPRREHPRDGSRTVYVAASRRPNWSARESSTGGNCSASCWQREASVPGRSIPLGCPGRSSTP
jgi:1-acyl-sn-glycerol-3-phosphate acyltransferase